MFGLLSKLKAEIQAWIDLSQRGRRRAAEIMGVDEIDAAPLTPAEVTTLSTPAAVTTAEPTTALDKPAKKPRSA
jgi:hypothetical protein